MEFKTKIKRRFLSLKELLINPISRKTALKKIVEILYKQNSLINYQIKKISPQSLFAENISCEISSLLPCDGNMQLNEILIICSLVKQYNPKCILEIGTFNGLTTLNMALNSSFSTKIHTLDLDSDELLVSNDFWDEDLKFIKDKTKQKKAFSALDVNYKIQQHLGNSLTYDFRVFGRPDFIFIDGGHSYHIIENDTAKALDILAPKGLIVWHDYSCHVEGVFNFLNKLQKKMPLVHIEDTSLVLLWKD